MLNSTVDPNIVFHRNQTVRKATDLAQLHYEADDKHSIDRVLSAPDDSVFLTASSFDTSRDRDKVSGGYACHLDANGKQLWRFDAPAGHSVDKIMATADGSTYLTLEPESHYSASRCVALNADGSVRWDFELPGYPHERFDTIRYHDGKVFLKAEKQVVALAADSGETAWEEKLPIYPSGLFHVVTDDGDQLFASDNFYSQWGYDGLTALTADGQEKEVELPEFTGIPAEVDRTLVYAGPKGTIVGASLSGAEPWQLEVEGDFMTPWVGEDKNIYFPTRGNERFVAVSSDGRLLWDREFKDMAPGGFDKPFKVGRDGSVFYRHDDGDRVVKIDAKGSRQEFHLTDGVNDFVPDDEGNVVALTGAGKLALVKQGATYLSTVEVENARVIDLEGYRNGVLEMRRSDEILRVPFTKESILAQDVEDYQNRPPSEQPPDIDIVADPDWIVIGDTPLPRNN